MAAVLVELLVHAVPVVSSQRHGGQVTMILYDGLSIEDLVLQCSLYLPVIHDKIHDDSSHAEHPNHCQPRSRLRLGRLLACRHGVHH